MKITLAQINYHVGNFEKNTGLIIDAILKAKTDKSDLIIFSELSLTGYPPHDLLENIDFIDNCNKYLKLVSKECTDITAIIGAPDVNRSSTGKKLFNAAWVLEDGRIKDKIYKSLLPTYDIFDEYRYFEPSLDFRLIKVKDKKIAVTICEDLWDEQEFDNDFGSSRMYSVSPMEQLSRLKPDLIINISASPFAYNKTGSKRKIFTDKALKYHLPLFMVNQVGANTDIIFEGNSLAISPNGKVFKTFPAFREHLETIDLQDVINNERDSDFDSDRIEKIYSALVLGLRDYFRKMNFKSAILGLSGGIDSAVCLCIASEALGSSALRALLMPSMYSTEHSVNDAIALSRNLDVEYDIINIERSYNSVIDSLKTIMKDQEPDVTEENIQARIRTIMLMAVSNKFGNILLNTSNKSETAVGYSTLYGDMAGSISVLGDVYKTDIYLLAKYINRQKQVIPENIISKEPSAELRPDQKDSDSLPDYNTLDSILYQYIELQKSVADIKGNNINPDLVNRVTSLINKNEYKRYQAPPILRISTKAFGIGRRMPLVALY